MVFNETGKSEIYRISRQDAVQMERQARGGETRASLCGVISREKRQKGLAAPFRIEPPTQKIPKEFRICTPTKRPMRAHRRTIHRDIHRDEHIFTSQLTSSRCDLLAFERMSRNSWSSRDTAPGTARRSSGG